MAGAVLELPTVRMFREDRLLGLATLVLSVFVLLPMFTTPILPLVDLGSHVGATGLLDEVALGRGIAPSYFEISTRVVPYWTVYAAMSLAEHVAGPFVAAKLIVGAALILLPLSAMRLLVAFGRSPRVGLLVFILSWDTNLYWGWITFQYGMILAIFTLAKMFEAKTFREGLWVLPLTVLVALTHVFAVALLGIAGGLFCLIKRPFWRTLGIHATALSGCLVALIPWAYKRLEGAAPAAARVRFDWHTPGHKIQHLYTYTVHNVPNGVEESGYAFAMLWIAPALLCLFRARSLPREERFGPLMVVIAAAGLYFALPFAIAGPIEHWWTYPRFGTYILIALLCLPAPRIEGRRVLALLPGLVAAVALHLAIARQFREYGKYVRPYLQIVDALPRGVTFFPLDLDDRRFKGALNPVLGQLHGYAAAAKASYDPHLFDQQDMPLLFKKPLKLPVINWFRPTTFTMEAHGRHYDYVIVHPIDRDPFPAKWMDAAELVRESGAWRLYKVKK